MSSQQRTSPTIAIVGGGPGGLTLARLLAVHGLAATVFEGDASAAARPQGGSLDLHPESGLRALALAGLTDGFAKLARYDDQEARVYDRDGRLLYEEVEASAGDRPEIDRAELRDLLLASLPAGSVAWGKKVTQVVVGDAGVAVRCAGEPPRTFDLVVGADGTWSRVRPLVSDVRPTYSGVTFVELELDDVDAQHPALAQLVGRGKMFALGDRKALIAQRNARGNVRIYVAQHAPEAWSRALAQTPGREVKAQLAALLAGWSASLCDFLTHSQDRARALPIYALPVAHRWPHRRGVTLIGDAAHVMSPFAGEGVNNAMLDATELALALAADADWDGAVEGFQRQMFARIQDSAIASAEGLELAMSEDAAPRMAEVMRGHRADDALRDRESIASPVPLA